MFLFWPLRLYRALPQLQVMRNRSRESWSSPRRALCRLHRPLLPPQLQLLHRPLLPLLLPRQRPPLLLLPRQLPPRLLLWPRPRRVALLPLRLQLPLDALLSPLLPRHQPRLCSARQRKPTPQTRPPVSALKALA